MRIIQHGFNNDSLAFLRITFPKQTSEGILTDNTDIPITLEFNYKNYKSINTDKGKINVSLNNTSYKYFALEIEDLVLTQVENPSKTIILNSACIKIVYP